MAAEKGIGEIRADSLYTAHEFCRRTGVSHIHLTQNIPTRKIAGRRWVLGRDLIDNLPPMDPPTGSNPTPAQRRAQRAF